MIAILSTAPYKEHLQSLPSPSLWLLRADYKQKIDADFCPILQPNYRALLACIDAELADRIK